MAVISLICRLLQLSGGPLHTCGTSTPNQAPTLLSQVHLVEGLCTTHADPLCRFRIALLSEQHGLLIPLEFFHFQTIMFASSVIAGQSQDGVQVWTVHPWS